jgi:ABC-type transport system involved in multi-copper enzyme maturation permease subunit
VSALTVARTTLLRASRRPSTYVIAGLSFLPAAVGALLGARGHGALEAGAPLALRLVAPLMVAAMVAGPVGESFENRTVVYWFTRPFRRTSVLLGEILGHTVIAAAALVLSGALLAVANALTGTADLASLARIPLGLALEALVLVSFSVAAGSLAPKHPALVALAVLVCTELALPIVWAKASYASISYHASVVGALPYAFTGADGSVEAPPVWVSFAVLAVWAIVPMIAASAVVEDRDTG